MAGSRCPLSPQLEGMYVCLKVNFAQHVLTLQAQVPRVDLPKYLACRQQKCLSLLSKQVIDVFCDRTDPADAPIRFSCKKTDERRTSSEGDQRVPGGTQHADDAAHFPGRNGS